MRPMIRKEPKGVVLIISPFNYPIFLTLGPLVCKQNPSFGMLPTIHLFVFEFRQEL